MGNPLKRLAAAGSAALLLFVGAGPSSSAPSSRVAWTVETVKLARSGDVGRGRALHKDCADCHGPAGVIDTPDVPNLAGQDALYVFKQLADYKSGTRASSIMNEAVVSLSERDMADLAAFYSAQTPVARSGEPSAAKPSVARLVSAGDGQRLIPACDACHGERGAGNPTFYGMPALRNQKPDDLTLQLKTFRTGERGNDVYRVMRSICARLTDAEIEALAEYYGAPPQAAAKASEPAKEKK